MRKKPKEWFLYYTSPGDIGHYVYIESDPAIIMAEVSNIIQDGLILQAAGHYFPGTSIFDVSSIRVKCEGKVVYEWSRNPNYKDLRTIDPFREGPYRYEDSRSPVGPAMHERRTPSASAPIVRVPLYSPMDSPSFFDLSRSAPPSMSSVRILEVRLDRPLPTGLSDRDTAQLRHLQQEYFRQREDEERRGAMIPHYWTSKL